MNRIERLLACASLSLVALQVGTAWAESAAPRKAAPLKVIELAVETSAADFAVPTGGVGNVTVQPCAGCRAQTLLLGTQARLLLDGRAVSAVELRRSLLAQPLASVAVFYRRGSTEITRVIVTSPSEARRADTTRRPRT